MPESQATKEVIVVQQTLKQIEKKQAASGFDQTITIENDIGANEAASVVWGRHHGVETPRIFLLALPKERWGSSSTSLNPAAT